MRCLPVLFATTIAAASSFAAAFTPGDLVVVQYGDGSAALSSAATAAFLNEFGVGGGSALQTIALPTATSGGNRAFTVSGSANSEGFIKLSTDGQYLTLGGYDAALGTLAVASTAPATVNRVVALVSANGSIDTSTALNNVSGNLRAVASDNGTRFWTSSSLVGFGYVASLGASTATQLATSPSNTRTLGIHAGQLFGGSGSASFIGVNQIGTGLPATSGQTVILSIAGGGTSPSPYCFFLSDLNPGVAGLDTAWVADDRSIVNGGGIQKYLFDGTSWTLSYTLGTGVASTVGARGLTLDLSGANPIIYATTTESSANRLITIVDAGAGSLATTLETAAANTAYRGVDFAPSIVPEPGSLLGFGAFLLVLGRRCFGRKA